MKTMGLNPSNMISEEITGQKSFPNVAGLGRDRPTEVDEVLVGELLGADIEWMNADSRYGEPQTLVVGACRGWTFHRAWYYWMASGPTLPLEYATPLHEKFGKSVRVEGHCGCPSPEEYCGVRGVSSYHVDNSEGLKALAETIKIFSGQEAAKESKEHTNPLKAENERLRKTLERIAEDSSFLDLGTLSIDPGTEFAMEITAIRDFARKALEE
jgi:hypothetical protein